LSQGGLSGGALRSAGSGLASLRASDDDRRDDARRAGRTGL